MNLAALADFVTVIRHGGFSKAARATSRPKPTLSRRVRDLEQELGVRLLERGGSSIHLTNEGLLLFEKAEVLLADLDNLGEAVGSEAIEPHGSLRISAPVLFATTFLGKVAAEFAKAHPRVVLEVVADDRRVDLAEERYDAVIRVNPEPNSDLVGRCFARDEMLLVADASLPRPAGEQEVPGIGFSYGPTLWKYLDGDLPKEMQVRINLRLSSMLMVRAAVLAAAGVAVLPRSLALNDLKSGKLVIWGRPELPTAEIWVLHKSRRLESSRLRAFIRFLENSFPNGELPPV